MPEVGRGDRNAVALDRRPLGNARSEVERHMRDAAVELIRLRRAELAAGIALLEARRREPVVLGAVHHVADVLLALGEVHQRAGRGVDALALGELGARVGVVARLDELAGLAEERVRVARLRRRHRRGGRYEEER